MDHESLLIINSGTSLCITPHRLDFITYKTSNMKIKDLSSSNKVAGEGLLRWKVEDRAGRVLNLDLPGYHIPGAEVCLLSPQVIPWYLEAILLKQHKKLKYVWQMVWFLMLIYVREVTFHSYYLFRVVVNSPLFGHMPLLTLPTTLFKQKQSLVPQITTYQVPKRNCCCGTSIYLMLIWLGFRLSCMIKSGLRNPLLWLLSTVGPSLLVCLGLPLVMFGALNAWLASVQKHILVLPKASPEHCNQKRNKC
jgi:hypothetical protein